MARDRRTRQAPAKLDSAVLHAIEAAAERAAKRNANRIMRLLTEKLAAIGINAATEEAQIENQKDAAWTRKMRVSLEARVSKLGYLVVAAILSLTVTVVGFLLNYFWKH